MRKAFAHTAAYDAAIAGWLAEQADGARSPTSCRSSFQQGAGAALRREPAPARRLLPRVPRAARSPTVAFAEVLQGKELSYNNLLDLDAALALALEFPERPARSSSSTTRPAAWPLDDALEKAYRTARAADEVSAFGGIVALNREVDEADRPGAGRDLPRGGDRPRLLARRRARCSRRRRTCACSRRGAALAAPARGRAPQLELRSISGGLLVQDRDAVEPAS